MPANQFLVVRSDERPDYRELISHVCEAVWPEFMFHDRVAREHWDDLFERFPTYQFALLDKATNAVAGVANSVPLAWSGDPIDLPEDGWDWAIIRSIEDHDRGTSPKCLCGIQVLVAPEYQGQGLSRKMVQALRDQTMSKGLAPLVVPVRPNLKSVYPLTPIDRYVKWKTNEGLPFDPWLRVHIRAGGRIVKICHEAMVMVGTVADWQSWTGMRFPESGEYVIPGALVPIEVDLAKGEARYMEPRVWIHHQVTRMPD